MRSSMHLFAVLAAAGLAALGCGGSAAEKSAAPTGKLLVVWTLDGDGTGYAVTLYNKGQAPLHVDRVGVEQNERSLGARLSLPGPHTVSPGGEVTVRLRVGSDSTFAPRTLIVESDAATEPVVRLPLDLSDADA
jgi:hypothetical protein